MKSLAYQAFMHAADNRGIPRYAAARLAAACIRGSEHLGWTVRHVKRIASRFLAVWCRRGKFQPMECQQ